MSKQPASLNTPKASKYSESFANHGETRVDPYFWMKNRDHAETLPYLAAENAYADKVMAPLKKAEGKLFLEMKKRIKEDDSSVPASWQDYWYYTREKKGCQYSIRCRKLKKKGKEEILIDGNKLAKGKKYFSLGSMSISPNQKLMAYSVDNDGSEKYVIYFKNLETGKTSFETIPNTAGGIVWANDNQTIFYTELNEKQIPYRVKRHKLGLDPKQDTIVFQEKDERHFVSVGKTASDQFIIIATHGKITSEEAFIPADEPTTPAKLIQARQEGIEYSTEHVCLKNQDYFLITTNYKALNFRAVIAPISKPGMQHWKDFVKPDPKALLTSTAVFKNFVVLFESKNAVPRVRVVQLSNMKQHQIKFPEPVFVAGASGDNFEFDTEIVRLGYMSPITPRTVIDYNMASRKKQIRKQDKVPGYKIKDYKCERVMVKSHDGVKVPMTLIYKKGLKPNGKNPFYLYGYGSYGYSLPAGFSTTRLSLLNRGFGYALAHIRGGQEMGRQWYEEGKFLKKKNTFLDFIACAEYLKKKKWSHPEKLVIAGGSAGGMLVGACANMRPELFKVVVAHVPFVDVINTMLDKTLPLTQTEYEEWGNPEDREYYTYMKSYSPYDNVIPQDYPHFFITAGLNDPRVTYWEPAKWVAKLRELKTNSNLVLFRTKMEAGHAGSSGRYNYLKEIAEEFAFLFKVLEVKI